MRTRLATPLALIALLAACSRSPDQAAPAAPPATPAAAPIPPPPPAPAGTVYVASASSLRREPTEASRVAGPGGKQVGNFLSVLQRGEPVTVLEARADWARVRTSGDDEGWLRRGALLEAEGATVATLAVQANVFERPDLLAASPGRKLEPGSLLLVVRQKAPFAEVNAGGGTDVWVLADRLVTDPAQVSVAKLVEKARWLERNKKHDEAVKILALGRTAFPGAPLLDLLATELGEAPAAPGAAPASPPTDQQ
jgi:SH3-like domain-containing protein